MKQNLERCARCGWNYPDDILSVLQGSLIHGSICAICARAARAAIHGVDIPFRPGTIAAEYEHDAKRWRKKHPESAPKVTA